MIFNATGYDDREAYITIQMGDVRRDIQLFPTKIKHIEDVEIVAKKGNPGREIMLNVVRKRDQMNQWNYPHSTEVYIKATEKIERKQKEAKNSEPKKNEVEDPFEEENPEVRQPDEPADEA